QRLELRQALPELAPLLEVALGRLERSLRRAHRAGGDVDPPAVEAAHRDSEALALPSQQVVSRDTHAVEGDLAGGLAVPAHLVLLASVAHALGVPRDGDRRDAGGARSTGANHRHEQVGGPGARDEGLA